MKQSKKKQSDKTITEKVIFTKVEKEQKKMSAMADKKEIPLEALINIKAKSLRELALKIHHCEIALKEYGNAWNDVLLFINLHKNKSLLNSWESLFNAQVRDLDASSKKGCLELKLCFNYVQNILEEYYTGENKDLSQLNRACLLLGSYNYKNMKQKDIVIFLNIESLLRGVCCEANGYWTAKLEEKKRNKTGGARQVKEQGKRNKEAIRKVIADLEITSLTAFRKDKELRDKFYEKSREKTKDARYKPPVSLSEKRISDIARAILKEQGAGLDTKPPL